MNFFQEYSLLIAFAVPCLAILGINVFLMLSGEEGTLLLPTLRPFPTVPAIAAETPSTGIVMIDAVAANDEFEREAA